MIKHLNAFFFAKVDGRVLGFLRIIFYLAVLLVFVPMPMEKLCIIPEGLNSHPTLLGSLIAHVRHENIFVPVLNLWKVSLVLSMLGLFSFISLPLAFLTTGVVFSVHNAYSCGFHGGNLFFLGMGIFMLSPAGSYWSLDCLIPWKRNVAVDKEVSCWPIKLMQINFVTMFFFAAITKLLHLGLGYLIGNEFYSVILMKKTWGGSFSSLFIFLLDHPSMARFLGGFGFLLELFCPLVFFGKKILILIVLSLAVMQLIIYLHFGISSFNAMPAIYAFWINWDFLLRKYEENRN